MSLKMANAKKTYLKDIRTLQIVRAILCGVGAVALIAMIRSNTVPINILFITKEALTSQAQTVFVPGMRNWFDAPIAYMAAIALLISGGIAIYRITRGELAYHQELKKAQSPLRWIDLGISSAITIEIVALLAGISDPVTVKLCAGAIVLTCALSWLADKQNTQAKTPDYSAFGIGVVSGILPWLAILGSLLFTAIYGMIRLPWYSYALVFAVLVGFCLIGLNQLQGIRKVKNWKSYNFVERNYLVIDIGIKVALVGILLAGLRG